MLRQSRDNVESTDAENSLPRLTASGSTATGRATLAHALLCDGQYDAALAEIEIALKDNPELADGQLVKGLTLARKGRHHEAIGPLRMALDSHESSRAAALSLILVYLRLEYHERAANVAQQLMREDDQDAQAHAVYGEVISRCNRPQEAMDAFRRSTELDPSLAPARLRLGELLLEAGELEQATAELVAALRLLPMNVRALQSLAIVLRRRGQGEQALAVYRRAVSAGQPTAGLFLAMAECYLELKLIPAALTTARVAMTLDSQLADCPRLLGRIYTDQGRHTEARLYEETADRLSRKDASTEPVSTKPSALSAPAGK